MRHIIIQECYENIIISDNSEKNSITQKESDELYKYCIKEKVDTKNIVWGRNIVTFINYVGFIKLSSVAIEILPKISINNNSPEAGRKVLLNMLVKSGIINVKYSDINSLHLYNMSLNEILSYLFANKLQNELRKGAYLEYIYVEDNSNSLKGRLMVQQHIRNQALASPRAYCRYEEFSIDNKLNQVMNYCITKLLKVIKSPDTIKLLRHCKSYFADVTDREVNHSELEQVKFSRLNKRYEEVMILAKMLLNGYSSVGDTGNEKSFAILFKMNEVFEKYITKILSRELDTEIVHAQHSKYKLLVNEEKNGGVFQLKPDIVIEKNGVEEIIIDTKWKSISSVYNRHGVNTQDIYQMYSYITRYENAKLVILLYPENENIQNTNLKYLESWMLDDDHNKKIKVCSVSLENETDTIKKLKEIIRI